jgi:hypothetical protein
MPGRLSRCQAWLNTARATAANAALQMICPVKKMEASTVEGDCLARRALHAAAFLCDAHQAGILATDIHLPLGVGPYKVFLRERTRSIRGLAA